MFQRPNLVWLVITNEGVETGNDNPSSFKGSNHPNKSSIAIRVGIYVTGSGKESLLNPVKLNISQILRGYCKKVLRYLNSSYYILGTLAKNVNSDILFWEKNINKE